MNGDIGNVSGGFDTARVTHAQADQAHRRQRDALALAFLQRRGQLDIAEILGLVEPKRRKAATT